MRWLMLILLGCDLQGASGRGETVNGPPFVEVEDATFGLGDLVRLLGVAIDPNQDELTYAWSVRWAPPLSDITTLDLVGASSSGVTFEPDRTGTYVLDLVVSDGEYHVSATALVTVLATENRPIARAGPDQVVVEGSKVSLDGTRSSSPISEFLLYDWSLLKAPTGSLVVLETDEAKVEFTPDIVGEYTVELSVHDLNLESLPDKLRIQVVLDNPMPGDVGRGFLDAGQVYSWGRTGECFEGIAHWSDHATVVGALDCADRALEVRLRADGTVRYLTASGALRDLVCDDCPGWDPFTSELFEPAMNDIVVANPCDEQANPRVRGFRNGLEGGVLVQCMDGVWYDEQGRTSSDLRAPLSYGPNHTVLVPGAVVDLAKEKTWAVRDWPTGWVLASRALDDGYWVAIERPDETGLWFVDSEEGELRFVGAYAPFADGLFLDASALDAEGSLFGTGLRAQTFNEVVSRRRLDGVADYVYELDDDGFFTFILAPISGP